MAICRKSKCSNQLLHCDQSRGSPSGLRLRHPWRADHTLRPPISGGCAPEARRYKEPARCQTASPTSIWTPPRPAPRSTALSNSGPTNYGYKEVGLYRESFERDSCGFGMIAHMDDQPSHKLVQTAVTALHRMTHRGAVAADGKTGDGCGLLMKKPDAFLRREADKLGFKIRAGAASATFSSRRTPEAPCARQGRARGEPHAA